MRLSGRELRALSGLTPALSRRLQRQLLAQLPPAAAQQLRRTLSLSAPAVSAAPPARSSSAACSTLPRPRRPEAEPDPASTPTSPTTERTPPPPRDSSTRPAADRPLLSKYLTPERALSLDESSDGGSVPSEPVARRHYVRLTPDRPRKRVSRFLRPDFFDAPPDESVYARQKREKEMETQKILREIRQKKSRALESGVRSPECGAASPGCREEPVLARKCVSPGILLAKERSRSNTPFFPILDNIKEAAPDTHKLPELPPETDRKTYVDSILDNKLTRPKSFPVKNFDQFVDQSRSAPTTDAKDKEESKDKTLPRESKLIRPKSYPTSSPSPEKVYMNRAVNKDETLNDTSDPVKEKTPPPPLNSKNDVEVSFSISLPRKAKPAAPVKTENSNETPQKEQTPDSKDSPSTNLVLKKFVVVNNESSSEKTDSKNHKIENGVANGNLNGSAVKVEPKTDAKPKVVNSASKKEITQKSSETEGNEKKGTIKKKIIKKVSSKSKTDVSSADSKDKPAAEKKKVTKKVKEKDSENGAKPTVPKKKSVLQSIGHKLEKFTSSKSNSPEKVCESKTISEAKKDTSKVSRSQREQSEPAAAQPPTAQPPTEAGLIRRAVTLADVAALQPPPGKTAVSKVLGLFKKFEPKEKLVKPLEKTPNAEEPTEHIIPESDPVKESTDDKPKRPTSLLLNGLGRKNYGKTGSDSVSVTNENNEQSVLKKDVESKNKNSLKLDFSRLPRVKKIVPTDPVIEPQIVSVSPVGKETDEEVERNGTGEREHATGRSRSRSRSAVSGSEPAAEPAAEPAHPLRNHEPTTPEREDIVDRIRRKSFYSRFNEKKQRRKSNLVGPGATEYDPIAVLHGAERSDPGSPGSLDLSPGYSAASDLSPSAERYRSLLTDTPVSTRNNLRFDNYGLNDKIDTYRSLDRNEFRKYPTRSYLEYEQGSYGTLGHRYGRTRSLLAGEEAAREPLRCGRTLSMYSPGNYATYRPKTTRNSAIILKETDKEPSPENILERIRQRKNYSISVTRKPDPEKDPSPRSAVPPQGEGDGAERAAEAR